MWNILKKKKVVYEQPKPKIGSYRIKSQNGKHHVEKYRDFKVLCDWLAVPKCEFDSIELARQWIIRREEIENAPVTYTEVNLDEL